MALIVKTNPTGVDIPINRFQTYLDGALTFVNWDSYHRVYLNPNEGTNGLVPERYDADGEYEETFYNDDFDITTWFFVSGDRDVDQDEGFVIVPVSLIVQADIVKLFPAIAHRADEELNNAFHLASENYTGYESFKLDSIVEGINSVYSEFDTDQIKLDDMSNRHAVRFNYTVRYDADCN